MNDLIDKLANMVFGVTNGFGSMAARTVDDLSQKSTSAFNAARSRQYFTSQAPYFSA